MDKREKRKMNLSQSGTEIMGILNMTPDSFSDGGKFFSVELAVQRAHEMIEEGASIIDIGGESTRPGAIPISIDEELNRVIPVIQALRAQSDICISIDTYKSDVARQAMLAGADIINDVWGGQKDPVIREVAKQFQCPYVLTHNRKEDHSQIEVADIINDLKQSIQTMASVHIANENIILDPGIGFAKSVEENLHIMNHLEEIVALGYPVLIGTSRKRFIRQTLDLPVDDVIEGTAATVAIAVYKGCKIIRVHDVRQMKRVALMAEAIRDSSFRNT